jgi:hypothetical protein
LNADLTDFGGNSRIRKGFKLNQGDSRAELLRIASELQRIQVNLVP